MFGTGLGIAYFMLRAYSSADKDAIRYVTRHAVTADRIFTVPSAGIQFLTGMWLTWQLEIPINSLWFVLVMALFVVVGLCWLTVLSNQAKIVKIINNGGQISDYRQPLRAWISVGMSAFAGVLFLFYLMVSKDGAKTIFSVG